jgi:hypothetical protein
MSEGPIVVIVVHLVVSLKVSIAALLAAELSIAAWTTSASVSHVIVSVRVIWSVSFGHFCFFSFLFNCSGLFVILLNEAIKSSIIKYRFYI